MSFHRRTLIFFFSFDVPRAWLFLEGCDLDELKKIKIEGVSKFHVPRSPVLLTLPERHETLGTMLAAVV